MSAAAPARPRSESLARAVPGSGGVLRPATRWLSGSKLGLVVMALVVGGGAGLGAAGFRELIFLFTWLVTGHRQFGQQGYADSRHVAFLGIYFIVLAPVVGGIVYGPLIQRFAREARGHGVPEVMLAVAENGGRIRPPVTIVKALASAICIGTGGSVGREGPIVQIGSAFASSLGQLVRMSESRLRIIVACGAAGGIAATFNAPLTGLFFGFEIVLREFSLDALLATTLSAVTADLVSRAFFGGAPFFSTVPHDLLIGNDITYLLMALLGVIAGLIGAGFKSFLYRIEDRVDELWQGRPEWARPAVGGVLLGLLLLALPQMYGVGYPVMDRVLAGHELFWFVIILVLGKVLAASLTLSIGGSGGVFAPSLFTGAAAGEAFGIVVHHLFGPAVGPPAMYGVVAMGGVFAGAAQAPLTAIASVAEMTGNFTLTLPIMLVTGIASAVSRRLSYGSIYTTKLLRRGIDIERPKATAALKSRLVSEVMQRLRDPTEPGKLAGADLRLEAVGPLDDSLDGSLRSLIGPVRRARQPQALFEDEDLAQALRQLVLFGQNGLPVLSHDANELRGWITRNDVLGALGEETGASAASIAQGARAADPRSGSAQGARAADPRSGSEAQADDGGPEPDTPLVGYQLLELELADDSPAAGRRAQDVDWPSGTIPVALTDRGEVRAINAEDRLRAGERVIVLARASAG